MLALGPPIVEAYAQAVPGPGGAPSWVAEGSPFFVADWRRLAIFFSGSSATAQRLSLTWQHNQENKPDFTSASHQFVVPPVPTINPTRLRWFPPVIAPWVNISVASTGTFQHLLVYPTNVDVDAQTPPFFTGSIALGGILAARRNFTLASGASLTSLVPSYVGRARALLLATTEPGELVVEASDLTGVTVTPLTRLVTVAAGVDVRDELYVPSLVVQATLRNTGTAPADYSFSIVGVPTP